MPAATRKRKGPSMSATSVIEGTIARGNDGDLWAKKGGRWIPYASTALNGLSPLTVDYLAKHIGKTITIYERGYESTWPTSVRNMSTLKFRPNGDAINEKKIIKGWLKVRRPAIKKGSMFSVDGDLTFPGSAPQHLGLQVDSVNKRLVSSNIINMEAFVQKS